MPRGIKREDTPQYILKYVNDWWNNIPLEERELIRKPKRKKRTTTKPKGAQTPTKTGKGVHTTPKRNKQRQTPAK